MEQADIVLLVQPCAVIGCPNSGEWHACFALKAQRRDGLVETVSIDGGICVCDSCRPENPLVWMNANNWQRIENALRDRVWEWPDRESMVGYWRHIDGTATERSEPRTRKGDQRRHRKVAQEIVEPVLPAHAHVYRPPHPLGLCAGCKRGDDGGEAGAGRSD